MLFLFYCYYFFLTFTTISFFKERFENISSPKSIIMFIIYYFTTKKHLPLLKKCMISDIIFMLNKCIIIVNTLHVVQVPMHT